MFKIKKYAQLRFLKKLKLLGTWMVSNAPTTVAIDVTNHCNLKCRHCYWWKEKQPQELNDIEMINFMKTLKKQGFRYAILYGGEPMMRPEIIKAASKIFDLVNVFTNGTLGYLDIPGQWILSLDGPEEIHDKLRGKGVFKKIISNLDTAPSLPIVHMTLTQINKHCIKEFIELIYKKNVKGFGISFYTPSIGKEETDLFIPLKERDNIVKGIVEISKAYRGFLGFNKRIAHHYLTDGDFYKWNSRENCDVLKRIRCFTSNGSKKNCTYGENADCSRCGCAAVATYRAALIDLDIESLFIMFSLV
ncbi:radical SAM protein [Candidatus Poribacteria bacterium]|nr:radical SAM protein [Candidatus Poribacteria bacterium]